MKILVKMWNNIDDLNKNILVDSDVIRHFIRGQKHNLLPKIFPDQMYILDMVESEICRSNNIKPIVENLIANEGLKRMKFPTATRFILEYSRLHDQLKFGAGEAACMAVAKHSKEIIGSNNLKDIKEYCIENDILYLTTLDFLFVAYEKAIMNESDIDYFLYLNLTGNDPSKIPFDTIAKFIASNPPILNIFPQTA